VVCDPPNPGRIHRITTPGSLPRGTAVATHGLGVLEAVRLAAAVDRLPGALVLLGVEAADVSLGHGLSPQVTAAIPALVDAIVDEVVGRH
jgi:hydrogenase maturation protease